MALFAALIAVFSGFVPALLHAGPVGQQLFIVLGFILLGLSYGQAAGALSANFEARYRYTGAALTADLAWLIGAGFAPLAALSLSAYFGLGYVSLVPALGSRWPLSRRSVSIASWRSGTDGRHARPALTAV